MKIKRYLIIFSLIFIALILMFFVLKNMVYKKDNIDIQDIQISKEDYLKEEEIGL